MRLAEALTHAIQSHTHLHCQYIFVPNNHRIIGSLFHSQ